MRYLLVDNSNTRTKFRLSNPDCLCDWQVIIPTQDISKNTLTEKLSSVEWDAALVSSVVPKKSDVLTDYLSKISTVHSLSYESNLPFGINYPNPSQIGADRLANSAAAVTQFKNPAIVLDFGTAVTFDVIAGEHKPDLSSTDEAQKLYNYIGGVIAPGLASMTEGLARRTALLPHIQLEEPDSAVGKSTEAAMLSGAIHGYRGLVREILIQIKKEMASEPIIIATGGDAKLITKGLPEIDHHIPQLTLEGLRIIANLNLSR